MVASDAIKELSDTNWSKDNESQGKAAQLFKGIAFSDDPLSNEFMKLMDKASTEAAAKVLDKSEGLEEGEEYVVEMKKAKMKKEMAGWCVCSSEECGWEGEAEDLDNGVCPECGSEVEMDESRRPSAKKEGEEEDDKAVTESKSFLQFVAEQEDMEALAKKSNDMDEEEEENQKQYTEYCDDCDEKGEKPMKYEMFVAKKKKKK